MRVANLMVLAFCLGGCSVVDYLTDCFDCALIREDAEFHADDPYGLLAFGLTVDPSAAAETSVIGSLDWVVENQEEIALRPLTIPKDLRPGQHRLILWRVPPGTWSLRNARLGEGRNSRISVAMADQSAATFVRPGRITIAGEIRIKGTKSTSTLDPP